MGDFTDDEFPPQPSSIQKPGENAAFGCQDPNSVTWVRAPEVLQNLGHSDGDDSELFNEINPNDIVQGNTGDCWFLAATSAYAEYPNAIKKLFQTQEKSADGSYTMSFFDFSSNDWEDVTIDDYIPTDQNGTPAFCKPNGNEMWMMLLEKAFAKFVGSYAAISGGSPAFAWIAFSGVTDGIAYWPPSSSNTGDWLRLHCDTEKSLQQNGAKNPLGMGFYYGPQYGDDASVDDMFTEMVEVYKNNDVAAVTWNNGQNGLVAKHVYAFLGIWGDPDGTRLVCFRNPYAWNSDEWQGDWSDNSSTWDQRPDLKDKLCCVGADGIFWMSWEDFEQNVEAIYVWPVDGLERGGASRELAREIGGTRDSESACFCC